MDVYAGIPYRNFFVSLFHIGNCQYCILFISFNFLTLQPCFAFKKHTDTSTFPFRAMAAYMYV
jgi:hypothetical protein